MAHIGWLGMAVSASAMLFSWGQSTSALSGRDDMKFIFAVSMAIQITFTVARTFFRCSACDAYSSKGPEPGNRFGWPQKVCWKCGLSYD